MPSAGRPLGVALLGQLRRRGVRIATVTHATGLSSTGDPGLDACLPLPDVDATLEEIDYALGTLGLDGVVLLTNYGDGEVYLGDARLARSAPSGSTMSSYAQPSCAFPQPPVTCFSGRA